MWRATGFWTAIGVLANAAMSCDGCCLVSSLKCNIALCRCASARLAALHSRDLLNPTRAATPDNPANTKRLTIGVSAPRTKAEITSITSMIGAALLSVQVK